MAVQTVNNRIAGYELTGIPDGQKDLFGQTHQTKFVELETSKEEI